MCVSSQNSKRLNSIDIARGIGIILVYLGHSLPPGNEVRNFIFLFHMPLFFFISGYLVDEKKYRIIDFCISRVKSILFPCVTYGGFATIIEVLTNEKYNIYTIKDSLPHVFWFLPVLFFSELLLFVLLKIFRTDNIRWGVFTILIIVGMNLLPLQCVYDLSLVPLCTSYCILGYLSKFLQIGKVKNSLVFSVFLDLPLIVYALCLSKTNNLDHHVVCDEYWGYFLSILGIFSVYLLSNAIAEKNNKLKQFLQYCGKNSLVIFALHITIIKVLVSVFLPIKDFFGPIEYHLCFMVENVLNIVLIY